MEIDKIVNMKISEIEKKYPFILSFFDEHNIKIDKYREDSFRKYLNENYHNNTKRVEIKLLMDEYINQMIEFLGLEDENINSLRIEAGFDKEGKIENFESIIINKSEIISIVGPTGSGKSRLLADIEWMADRDTPTNRRILINGLLPDKKKRFSGGSKLVSQLSQNMNFVMDLTVNEFLNLHAESRMIDNKKEIIKRIVEAANELAGESFMTDTNITSLSGGQSRALMIADTAILSSSPIVLIDEIENAGIDRKRALNVLVNEEKIVLMATHDPALALMANKRIVIENGGITNIIETDNKEKEILKELEIINKRINIMRTKLRKGEKLDT